VSTHQTRPPRHIRGTLKPGWQTSEFWVTALTIAGLVISSIAAPLAPRYAALGAAISAGLYAISRGLAKLFPPKDTT
jgi:hypothetical protein